MQLTLTLKSDDGKPFAELILAVRELQALPRQLANIEARLGDIESWLAAIHHKEKVVMKEFDELIAEVEQMSTVQEGIAAQVDATVAFEHDLKTKLDAALAGPTVDVEAIKSASAALAARRAGFEQNKQALADAIVANTPAETPTT